MCSSTLTTATPREAALSILREWFGPPTQPDAPGWLAPHQAEAVQRLSRILEVRRGAILADSVGLGKTHIALGILDETLQRNRSPLLVIPAALQNHWARHLRLLKGPVSCTVVTHTALSRGYISSWLRPTLIVVDEAHQFRN